MRRWTQPKFNNGIRHRGLKQQLRLGSKGNVNEALKQTMGLEVKLGVGTSVRFPKMSVKTLWKCLSPPMRKKILPTARMPEMQEHQPLSEVLPAPTAKEEMIARFRLLRTSNLKEEPM
jgi:hypothetical protein